MSDSENENFEEDEEEVEIDKPYEKKEDHHSISIIVVDENDRITRNTATTSEISFIISSRAAQISNGSEIFVNVNSHDPVLIALTELIEGKCCLKIERLVYVNDDGSKVVEHWNVNEMAKPSLPQIYKLLTSTN